MDPSPESNRAAWYQGPMKLEVVKSCGATLYIYYIYIPLGFRPVHRSIVSWSTNEKKIDFFHHPSASTGARPLTKQPEDSGYEIGQILEKGKSPGNEFVTDVQCHVKWNFYSLVNSPGSILLFHTPPSMHTYCRPSYKANGVTTNDLR